MVLYRNDMITVHNKDKHDENGKDVCTHIMNDTDN